MDWQPQLMTTNGEAYEHVITVPKNHRTLLYKFRIGDDYWIHDVSVNAGMSTWWLHGATLSQLIHADTNLSEPDNLGGFNNRFDIPDISYPESELAVSECSEATELESVAAVESVADTMSEMTDEDGRISHDEGEFVDFDDVISEPDFPGMAQISFDSNSFDRRRGAAHRPRRLPSVISKMMLWRETIPSTCQFP
jgi:hypothetical protein